jgi:ABC-type phosphate transport system permease subunit
VFADVCPVLERPVPRLLGWLLRLIEQLQVSFTALPMIIYNWAGEAKAEFKTALAPAAIIVLMAITFLCNGVAVFLRNRYDKRW